MTVEHITIAALLAELLEENQAAELLVSAPAPGRTGSPRQPAAGPEADLIVGYEAVPRERG